MLQEGDIIELKEGDRVYATLPEYLLYSNRKESLTPAWGEALIGGELAFLAGRYVVYKTCHNGGGVNGTGRDDVYPDGHHVFCERLDDSAAVRVDFYQSGFFTAMLPDLKPVGKAARKWVEIEYAPEPLPG